MREGELMGCVWSVTIFPSYQWFISFARKISSGPSLCACIVGEPVCVCVCVCVCVFVCVCVGNKEDTCTYPDEKACGALYTLALCLGQRPSTRSRKGLTDERCQTFLTPRLVGWPGAMQLARMLSFLVGSADRFKVAPSGMGSYSGMGQDLVPPASRIDLSHRKPSSRRLSNRKRTSCRG